MLGVYQSGLIVKLNVERTHRDATVGTLWGPGLAGVNVSFSVLCDCPLSKSGLAHKHIMMPRYRYVVVFYLCTGIHQKLSQNTTIPHTNWRKSSTAPTHRISIIMMAGSAKMPLTLLENLASWDPCNRRWSPA